MFQKIMDIREGYQTIQSHRYGMIVAEKGQVSFVQMRGFPKLVSAAEVLLLGAFTHKNVRRDRVQVFYNHPRSHDNFLAAKYAVSDLGTTLATMRAAHNCMDEIARLKRCDAALCQVANKRISERIIKYWGWEPHNLKARGRHYIRRYYGEYPAHTDWIAEFEPASPAAQLQASLGLPLVDLPASSPSLTGPISQSHQVD